MTVFDIHKKALCVRAGWWGTVVQSCFNIKEHSSKVLTNTATWFSSLSLSLSLVKNQSAFFFLETVCWPREQPEVLHEHFTFSLFEDFTFLNGHQSRELIRDNAALQEM